MQFDFSGMPKYFPVFLTGAKLTLLVCLSSLLLAIVLALPIAFMNMSRYRILRYIGKFYNSVFRGVPLIVQILFVYFAVPEVIGHNLTTFQAGTIALGLNSAAFLSESLRGGITAVDSGQREAAMALGLRGPRIMFGIIIPQAFKSILPALVNEIIGLFKGTSLVSTIGYVELLRATQLVITDSYRAFEPYIVVAAIYYVIVMLMTAVANRLEKWVKKSDRAS